MIKIEKTDVYGFEAAIRGMRNPMNSWDKSDSNFSCKECSGCYYEPERHVERNEFYVDTWCEHRALRIGRIDRQLMKSLAKAGDDHGKFLRMINVTVDITAPRYWWTEFDTYKVGTVANSCSTMHKLASKPIELSDFSIDDFEAVPVSGEHLGVEDGSLSFAQLMENTVNDCEYLRKRYLETNDKTFWRGLIQLLPQSYNQRRTVLLNYAVLKNMYFARRDHKLDEWHDFCDWVLTLPYFREIVVQEDEQGGSEG